MTDPSPPAAAPSLLEALAARIIEANDPGPCDWAICPAEARCEKHGCTSFETCSCSRYGSPVSAIGSEENALALARAALALAACVPALERYGEHGLIRCNWMPCDCGYAKALAAARAALAARGEGGGVRDDILIQVNAVRYDELVRAESELATCRAELAAQVERADALLKKNSQYRGEMQVEVVANTKVKRRLSSLWEAEKRGAQQLRSDLVVSQARAEAAERSLATLRRVLERYATHEGFCFASGLSTDPLRFDCICGLDAALAEATQPDAQDAKGR